jgi:hypothetical protein
MGEAHRFRAVEAVTVGELLASPFLPGVTTEPGVILHLGAGGGSMLPRYRASGARRIIVVEPDPASGATLQEMARTSRDLRVVRAALADAHGMERLYQLSFPALSSLRKPLPALAALFPGCDLSPNRRSRPFRSRNCSTRPSRTRAAPIYWWSQPRGPRPRSCGHSSPPTMRGTTRIWFFARAQSPCMKARAVLGSGRDRIEFRFPASFDK